MKGLQREPKTQWPLRLAAFCATLAGALALSGCLAVAPENVQDHVEVLPAPRVSAGADQRPFVLFLQGTGGGNARAEIWSEWFHAEGVSTVIVDSARMRGRTNLEGVDSYHLAADVSLALDAIRSRGDLDFSRYALMGFSRGGTAALQAGSVLKADQPKPKLVFSLYPGGAGQCPNTYGDETRVLVFYGEDDASGTRNGNRARCQRMAQSGRNSAYHGFAGVHHGYDSLMTSHEHDGAGAYLVKHNEAAVQATRRLIAAELKRTGWSLRQ